MGCPLLKSRPPCGSHWSHQHKVNIKRPLLSTRPRAGCWHKARNQNQLLNFRGFPGGSDGKVSACNAGNQDSIPGDSIPLEKEMVTHSSILAWNIPWMEEPGRLYSPWGRKELKMQS